MFLLKLSDSEKLEIFYHMKKGKLSKMRNI